MKTGISTHTLTWSVTFIVEFSITSLSFQLTRSRGAWLLTNVHRNKIVQFQLTRSRGAWRVAYRIQSVYPNFNSHAHVERDRLTFWSALASAHFNSHAHVERDNITKIVLMRLIISTHTLTWSVTVVTSKVMSIFSFQLTRSRGAWRQPTLACLGSRQFQLTRSRGAWPALVSPFEPVLKISTHTLTWSVTIDTPTTPFL